MALFRDRIVTVQSFLNKEASFTTTLHARAQAGHYVQDFEKDREQVLKDWSSVTGLAFYRMPFKDYSDEPGNEGYRIVEVEHPLDNRASVRFVWEI